MGIYIPNMEKPKSCWGCFAEYDTIICQILEERIPTDGVYPDCPLIEIPQEDEEAVSFIVRMRKAMREGKSLREFIGGEMANNTRTD